MSTTFIDSNTLPSVKTAHGEDKEILNEALAGAKNVKAILHRIDAGQTFEAAASDKHQLVYLMDGKGSIRLEGKDYEVSKGAGVYLGPAEGASVTAAAGQSLKLFHLVVPQIPA
jgi:quercetin dioxygenase-like cupin family protein